MPNTTSAKKQMRQNEKRRQRNRTVLSRTRTHVKAARAAIKAGDYASAEAAVLEAVRQLDRAASKGVIHRNNADRKKSRLMKDLSRLQSAG